MRKLLVQTLTSLGESHPYLLGAAALVGFFWLARSFIHKARLFTEHLLTEVRGGKAELHEWLPTLRELWRELTTWTVTASGNSKNSTGVSKRQP